MKDSISLFSPVSISRDDDFMFSVFGFHIQRSGFIGAPRRDYEAGERRGKKDCKSLLSPAVNRILNSKYYRDCKTNLFRAQCKQEIATFAYLRLRGLQDLT